MMQAETPNKKSVVMPQSKSQNVNVYGKSENVSIEDDRRMKEKIKDMILLMTNGDVEESKQLLENLSKYQDKEKIVPGVRSMPELHAGQIEKAYIAVSLEYAEWEKGGS